MTIPLRMLTLALLASGTVGLANCKKDKEPDPDKRSQREIWLTSSGWSRENIIDVFTTSAGVVTTSSYPASSFFPSCNLDDLTHFNADRTVTVDDGPLQCQPPALPSTTTWSFASNETEINFDSGTNGPKITTLTATNLALEFTDTLPGGTTLVQTQTYVAR